jgi:hypothetical protein
VALPELYSRRKRQEQAQEADVYQYDSVPGRLRVQVVQILADGLGPYHNSRRLRTASAGLYDNIVKTMRREIGVHELSNQSDAHPSS